MDLELKNKTIAVGGATSGLGRAVAENLLAEGATVIGMARGREGLTELEGKWKKKFIAYPIDLTIPSSIDKLANFLEEKEIYGICLNAGGPPPKALLDTDMDEWDSAYHSTVRWKIQLAQQLVPYLLKRKTGRVVFVESVSIKQPIDGLALSNTFRAAIAGYVKSLSREVGDQGVTFNILAPGYHATPRINTVLEKSAELQKITLDEAKAQFAAEVPTGTIGDPQDFGSLAAWLFSPHSRFINGQTISVDGGMTRHLTG